MKAAVFSGSANKFQLIDFFVERIPAMVDLSEDEDPPPSIEELVAQKLRERNLTNADVVAAVDSKDCVVREISVPFTRDEQIRKTIPFEAENYFHSFDVAEVVLEYVKTEELDGKSRLVLLALRNEIIDERLKLCQAAGCDPMQLDLDGAALFNSFSRTPYYNAEGSALIVDMGAAATKIVLVERGRLKKIRSLRTGSAVLEASRMLAEPAAVGAGDGAPVEEHSLEARFLEIEEALKRLEPFSLEDDPESPETPIAILPDTDYSRIRDTIEEEIGRELESRLGGDADASAGAESDVGDEPSGEETGAAGSVEVPDALPDDLDVPDLGASADEVETIDLARPMFPGAPRDEGADYDEYLQRVAIEIQRTVATTPLATPVELVCLTGGMSRRPEAARYLGDEFDIECVSMEFDTGLPSTLDSEQMVEVAAEGSVAVGLGLKGLGIDLVGVDFRKGPFRYEHKFERLRLSLLVCSLACLFLFLQLAFWAYHNYEYQSNLLAEYQRGQQEVFTTFFDKPPSGGTSPLRLAQKQQKTWQGRGAGDVARFVTFPESMHDFAKTLSATGLFFELESANFQFRVKNRQVNRGGKKVNQATSLPCSVKLRAKDSQAFKKIDDAFKSKSTYFTTSSESTQNKTDGFRLDMKVEFRPEVLAKLEG